MNETSKSSVARRPSENIERKAWRRAVATVVFEHLSIKEVADVCGVTWVTAFRWKAKGKIPLGQVSAVLRHLKVSMDFIVHENVERY